MAIPSPVSSAYCVPYQAQFDVHYAHRLYSHHKFSIKDAQGTLLFDVKSKNPIALHTRRVLCDASGNVLVLLKRKMASWHNRWSAYRGEDENDTNLLFTLSAPSIKARSFDVFLASNQTSMPDFVIEGDYKKYNYEVLFNGTTVAKVRKKINNSWITVGSDREHGVTLYPNVDQAFIASIVALMDRIKRDNDEGAKTKVRGGTFSGYNGGSGIGGGGGGCGSAGGCGGCG